ncbi:MAG: GNAT family N-acetyltransferase [Chloroflexi bacterium]|nr:GNAT family N-acetyltransferase [Chloroflexota bacterium]
MIITRYDSGIVFSDFCAEWSELLAESDANQIFLTCEWLSAWWDVFQPGPLCVLVLRDSDTGRWMGIAPWFIQTDQSGQRVIYTVGCEDVTDYLDIVIRRGSEDQVLADLADWLADHADEFDRAELCNIPEGSPVLAKLPALIEPVGFSAAVEVADVCPLVVLPEQFEDYFMLLDKKDRHELRRKMRRAAGTYDWYIVGPEHDLAAELPVFMSLMAASAPSKAEFLQNPLHRAFFESLIPRMAQCGWLQLAFLTVKGEPAAAYLSFVYSNRLLIYNSGLNPAVQGTTSPGIVLMSHLIEHAIRERRTVVDFLRGNESYKYDMGGRDTQIFSLLIDKRSEG